MFDEEYIIVRKCTECEHEEAYGDKCKLCKAFICWKCWELDRIAQQVAKEESIKRKGGLCSPCFESLS